MQPEAKLADRAPGKLKKFLPPSGSSFAHAVYGLEGKYVTIAGHESEA